jgi:hypothetical protein
MAQKMSTGLCNQLLDTNPLKTIFAAGFVDLYSGTVPASADASIGAAVLQVRVGAPGPGTGIHFATAAAAGVLSKMATETWNGTVSNSATVTFYRMVTAADDGTLSTTQPRIQGAIGTGGADMNLGAVALVAAAPFVLNYETQAFVPS